MTAQHTTRQITRPGKGTTQVRRGEFLAAQPRRAAASRRLGRGLFCGAGVSPAAVQPRRPHHNSRTPARCRRTGLAAIELAMVLPILAIMLAGFLEFTLLFYARSSVVEASRAGARAASRVGSDQTQIEREAGLVLFPTLLQGLQIELAGGIHSGDPVTVAVQVPMNLASPDLLWIVGYSLQGKYLYAESTMIKE